MTPCESFQGQLLPMLYELLDEPQRAVLSAHVSGCAACRAALARAEEQQSLLATAAKHRFQGVSFVPPAVPEVLRMPPAAPTKRSWRGWAMAAAVALAVLGGGSWGIVGWNQRKADAAGAQNQMAQVTQDIETFQATWNENRQRSDQEVQAIRDEINRLISDWDEADKKRRELSDKKVKVDIRGPRSLQPGGKNQFQIDVRGARPAKPPELRIVNPADKKVFFAKTLDATGRVNVELPATLPVKPGVQLNMEIVARGERDEALFREQLPLVAPTFLTHLVTDRPMYRPGETVYFRSLTLERFSLTPAEEDFRVRFGITAPNGQEVFKSEGPARVAESENKKLVQGPDGKELRGLAAGEFVIPETAPGGEYVLTVSDAQERFPAETRRFLVNRYQRPRLNKEFHFTRKSYGPGEQVEAKAIATYADTGAVFQFKRVVGTLRVDDQVLSKEFATDQNGAVSARFDLPMTIATGSASLALNFIDNNGPGETLLKPVPLALNHLLVDFYPEGGDLIAGVNNRVYFQVQTPANKPAELRGRLVNQRNETIARVQTLNDDHEPGVNQGLGAFQLVPKTGESYRLIIDTPIGVEAKQLVQRPGALNRWDAVAAKFPEVKPDGVVLHMPQGVVGDEIGVQLHNGPTLRRLLVGAYCRGRLIDQSAVVVLKPGESRAIALQTAPDVGGVYRITVFENPTGAAPEELVPRAERLVYRPPTRQLQLKLDSSAREYQPGERVKISLETVGEKKQTAPSVLLVSVVDLSVLKLADEKTARGMPTHFFLTTEIKQPEDLEYADFLVGEHPKAHEALDMLLGTQGWRRFAEQNPQRFQQQRDPRLRHDASRLLAMAGQGAHQHADLLVEKLDREMGGKFVDSERQLAEKQRAASQLAAEAQNELQTLQTARDQAQAKILLANESLRNYKEKLLRYGLGGLFVLLLAAGVTLVTMGIARHSRDSQRAVPLLATGLGILGLLFVVSLVGTLYYIARGGDILPQRQMDIRMAQDIAAEAPAMPEMKVADVQPNLGAPMPPGNVEAGAVKNGMPGGKDIEPKGGLKAEPKAARPALPPLKMKAGNEAQVERALPPGPGAAGAPPGGEAGPAAMPMPGEGLMPGQLMDAAERPAFAFGGGAPEALRQNRLQNQLRAEVARRLQRRVLIPEAVEPFIARQYAHRHVPTDDGMRTDFTDTLLWQPVLVMPAGKGEVHFELSDSVTQFQVLAMGHTLDGRLGSGSTLITSRLPYSLEPKVPVEISSTDKLTLPVTITNNANRFVHAEIEAAAAGLTIADGASRRLLVDPGRATLNLQALPAITDGLAKLSLKGRFGDQVDRIERSFKIVPEGFPIVGAHSDLLEGRASHVINLPEEWVKDTLKCSMQVFPSRLADLQKGLEAMLREPCGCFEQSSSSNYPNVLILNYLQETKQARPEIEQRARHLLASGYRQITSFECIVPEQQAQRRGYEWFGQTAPPHEALSAYGLLQFKDMAGVHEVDKAMVERTRKYLLGQRDGQGGFKRNPRALDSFGRAPAHITDAYIVWALAETGDDDLSVELKALRERAEKSHDPYFLSLAALAHLHRQQADAGAKILKALAELQKEDGRLEGTQTSITGSTGRDLHIETSALATLAWLKANRPEFNVLADKAAQWITKQRGGYGGFGATQSTILALKALIAHTRDKKQAVPSEVRVFLGDDQQPIAVQPFVPANLEPITIDLPAAKLKPGANKIAVEMAQNTFPVLFSWSYHTTKPANAPNCPVQLSTSLDRQDAREGDTVHLKVSVENKTDKGQGMAVAIVGLPAGLSLPDDFAQLKEYARLEENGTKPGKISFWEIRGRELILYWRDLAPKQKIDVDVDVICRLPGEYRGPASRAYLYYNSDLKFWVEPLAMIIAPAAARE